MHIVILFWFDDFWRSYGTLIYFHWKFCLPCFSKTLDRIWWNFVGLISTMPSCAYHYPVPVRWVLAELWDFKIFSFKILSAWFLGIQWNLVRLISTMLSCAYRNPAPIQWFLEELWDLGKLFLLYFSEILGPIWMKLCMIDKYHALLNIL